MNRCLDDCRQRSHSYSVISRIIGIVVFLIMVVILNILLRQITSPFFQAFVTFINANIWLVILFSLLFMFADVFRNAFFPLNLPYPLFSSVGSVFFLMFLYRFMEFIDTSLSLGFFGAISWTYYVVAPLIFIIALICGYLSIFRKICCPRRAKGQPCPGMVVGTPLETSAPDATPPSGTPPLVGTQPGKSWEDIAAEFRELIYDIIRALRLALRPEK